MLGTAYYRHGPTISYEVFYRVHYLFLVVYSLTIAHTVDAAQRSGEKNRSQTFTWFIAPLLYYFCDYTMMWFNQKFRVSISILCLVNNQILSFECSHLVFSSTCIIQDPNHFLHCYRYTRRFEYDCSDNAETYFVSISTGSVVSSVAIMLLYVCIA